MFELPSVLQESLAQSAAREASVAALADLPRTAETLPHILETLSSGLSDEDDGVVGQSVLTARWLGPAARSLSDKLFEIYERDDDHLSREAFHALRAVGYSVDQILRSYERCEMHPDALRRCGLLTLAPDAEGDLRPVVGLVTKALRIGEVPLKDRAVQVARHLPQFSAELLPHVRQYRDQYQGLPELGGEAAATLAVLEAQPLKEPEPVRLRPAETFDAPAVLVA